MNTRIYAENDQYESIHPEGWTSSKMKSVAWTQEEIDILKKYFPVEGVFVSRRLKNRTQSACQGCAQKLGIKYVKYGKDLSKEQRELGIRRRHSCIRWTDEEVEILKKYFPLEGTKVYKRMVRRNMQACRAKAYSLRLVYSVKWTDLELEILRKYYPIEGCNVSKRLKGRSKVACTEMARSLGIRYENQWNKKDIEVLLSCDINNEVKLMQLFPGKKLNAIKYKYQEEYEKKFGIWSNREILLLREYYPKEGMDVVKRFKNKTVEACLNEVKKLGLQCKCDWTKKEFDILRKYYPSEGGRVSKRLPRRTVKACRKQAEKLGLKKNDYC